MALGCSGWHRGCHSTGCNGGALQGWEKPGLSAGTHPLPAYAPVGVSLPLLDPSLPFQSQAFTPFLFPPSTTALHLHTTARSPAKSPLRLCHWMPLLHTPGLGILHGLPTLVPGVGGTQSNKIKNGNVVHCWRTRFKASQATKAASPDPRVVMLKGISGHAWRMARGPGGKPL